MQAPNNPLRNGEDDHVREDVQDPRRHNQRRIIHAMPPRHHLVPDLAPGRAAEVLDDGAGDVEHDVDPERGVAGPPEGVVDAEGDEEPGPFDEDAGFEEHDGDAVEDVVVVYVLGWLGIARVALGRCWAYVDYGGEVAQSDVPLMDVEARL
jgi:hypothetical protein